MATGDQDDMQARIKAMLPASWFADSNPVLQAAIAGAAYALAFVYSLLSYAKKQTRIKTASDGWLDLIALDFFGGRIRRKTGEADNSFRSKIRINLFRQRGTRQAVIKVLEDLTGRTPDVFEQARTADVACLDHMYLDVSRLGSMDMTYEFFITAYRPEHQFQAGGFNGLDSSIYGLDTNFYLAPQPDADRVVTDDDIYTAIASVIPYGVTAWTRIVN
jgi:hypothetical protein